MRAQAAILATLNVQIKAMEEQVEAHFGKHPAAEIYLSQPGLGVVLGARVLAEFGDDKARYADARARKNYAGTSPITRQSGKRKLVLARYVHNDRLVDALGRQAFAALRASPGARGYYDQQRARGVGREFECFYNGHRPHQGLANARPQYPLPTPIAAPDEIARLRVRRRDRLGGILHEYEHAA